MIMKEKYWNKIMLITLLLVFVTAAPACAAKVKLTKLTPGHTYKAYDITGDNKKDTIKISGIKTEENVPASMAAQYVTVTVNKKSSFTIYSYNGFDIRCMHKGKKGVLLAHTYAATAGSTVVLYRCLNDSWSEKSLSLDFYGVRKLSLSGKKLVLKGCKYVGGGTAIKRSYTFASLRKMLTASV